MLTRSLLLLHQAWAFGAYLQATDFQDAIADVILEKATAASPATYSVHKFISAKSNVGAPIRKLLVDIAVWKWDVSTLEAQSNEAAWSDFFRDLSIALLKTRGSTEEDRIVKPSCDYHEHRLKNTFYRRMKRHGFS